MLVVAMCHFALQPTAWAQTADESRSENTAAQYGIGAASYLLTVPYGALKVVFATLGAVFGGMTYIFSAGNTRAAKAVWYTSLRGTYVIGPEHLKGHQAIRFFGTPPTEGVIE